MKILIRIGVVAMFFITSKQLIAQQADSARSTKNLIPHKNNLKTQALLFLPLTTLELRYERALSKKLSLGLDAQYSKLPYKSSGHKETVVISPIVTYYFSKYKLEKYNRGFFAQVLAPISSATIQDSTSRYEKGVYLAVGGGYQWIIRRRLVVNVSAAWGPALYSKEKNSLAFGDSKWHSRSNSFVLQQYVGVGFAF